MLPECLIEESESVVDSSLHNHQMFNSGKVMIFAVDPCGLQAAVQLQCS